MEQRFCKRLDSIFVFVLLGAVVIMHVLLQGNYSKNTNVCNGTAETAEIAINRPVVLTSAKY